MKRGFYPKLAWDGIRKNKRIYLPYILTCSGMVMMFYIIHHLAAMPALKQMSGGTSTASILGFGVWVIAIFALLFLTYTNSFLMRRRQKEFGLYHILGMGKKNLSLVYVWETLFTFGISLFCGLGCGIALSKMAELGLVRLIGDAVTYDFWISEEVLWDTLMAFGIIFCLLLCLGLLRLWRLNAVALLKSESIGEKPPRANYLLGLGGLLILGGAYYIAVSIESPLLAVGWFFVAVVMVIIATYMIFISGSVMLCRILQKNKGYYYKKNHFVSVSSMAYRMKRNGAGLASICILSTMVLVMILGSGSLYFGAEDSLKARFPRDISVSMDFAPYEEKTNYAPEKVDALVELLDGKLEENGLDPQTAEHYLRISVTGMLGDGRLAVDPETVNTADVNTMNQVSQIYFVPLDEYNDCMGADETLNDNEALIYCVRRSYTDPEIQMPEGTTLTIKKQVEAMMGSGDAAMDVLPSVFLVVRDLGTVYDSINTVMGDGEYFGRITLSYSFYTGRSAEEQIGLADSLRASVRELDYTGTGGFYSYSVECREAERSDFYGTFGGLFYLGIILSLVFVFATVLIIYYKQITEGYEDESRFAIMRKVGMTQKDIRKSINSQMLTVFFLPLITSVLHLSFAFPMIQKLLALFNLRNVSLMILVLAATALVFGVLYAVIYKCTSNVYYSIVSGKQE